MPTKDPNPHYHTSQDKIIDRSFAVDIVSAVALAVKELANK
jgi:hypothetical protein